MLSWAPFLLQMGFVDDAGYTEIMDSALLTKSELDAGNFLNATVLFVQTENIIQTATGGIDFNNVLHTVIYSEQIRYMRTNAEFMPLAQLMIGQVSEILKIPKNIIWGSNSLKPFQMLAEDFMKPNIEFGK